MFGLFKRKDDRTSNAGLVEVNEKSVQLMMAERRFEILRDCTELIRETIDPNTFFYRYAMAVEEAMGLMEMCDGYESGLLAADILDLLLDEKEEIFDSYFLRCYEAGRLVSAKEDILSHSDEIPDESLEYFWNLYWDAFYSET